MNICRQSSYGTYYRSSGYPNCTVVCSVTQPPPNTCPLASSCYPQPFTAAPGDKVTVFPQIDGVNVGELNNGYTCTWNFSDQIANWNATKTITVGPGHGSSYQCTTSFKAPGKMGDNSQVIASLDVLTKDGTSANPAGSCMAFVTTPETYCSASPDSPAVNSTVEWTVYKNGQPYQVGFDHSNYWDYTTLTYTTVSWDVSGGGGFTHANPAQVMYSVAGSKDAAASVKQYDFSGLTLDQKGCLMTRVQYGESLGQAYSFCGIEGNPPDPTTASADCSVTVGGHTSSLPDLSAWEALQVEPASPSPSDAITLHGWVANYGGALPAVTFPNLFQVNNAPNGGGSTVKTLVVDASGPIAEYTGEPAPHVPDPGQLNGAIGKLAAGSYSYRLCADNNASWAGLVDESNEDNNCNIWINFNVGTRQFCPDGSPAPNNDPSQCLKYCPDGSPAPHNDPSLCPPSHCTDPRNCLPPDSGCNIAVAPGTTTPGSPVLLGWASACDTLAAGCKSSLLPVVAAGTSINGIGNVPPSSGNNPITTTVGTLPATYTLSGYLTYWPTGIKVANSDYQCRARVVSGRILCPDGTPAPHNDPKQCPKICERGGYPRCSADSSSIVTLDASCTPKQTPCPWWSRDHAYGCVGTPGNASCLTPPKPKGAFDINPKLVRSGSRANITWTVGPQTACALSATNNDNNSGITGTGGRPTMAILGQTTYTFTCLETLTGDRIAPQTITVSVVPTFEEK